MLSSGVREGTGRRDIQNIATPRFHRVAIECRFRSYRDLPVSPGYCQ